VLDWNPDDPDTVKVHYDVSGWSLDQRAELSEALAEAALAHVWEADEVVVPDELEADVDALFERLEELLGPFAIALPADEEGVEFGLDEWPSADRQTLTQALIEGEIPHRWDGTTVSVAAEAEAAVDTLLDEIEQGTLVLTGATAPAAPEGALSDLFTAADRLAKDPEDTTGRDGLRELVTTLDRAVPPYGMSTGTWAGVVDSSAALVELVDDDSTSASDVIGAAQDLRSKVRQHV